MYKPLCRECFNEASNVKELGKKLKCESKIEFSREVQIGDNDTRNNTDGSKESTPEKIEQ